MADFDSARDTAIEVMRDAIRERGKAAQQARDWKSAQKVPCDATAMAKVALSALLAARSSTTCETCGGEGYQLVESTLPTADIPIDCPSCDGSGTVPGGPLILLAPEQVGWGQPRKNGPFSHLHDANLALYSETEPTTDKPGWVPVFVARESFEENPE